MNKRVTILLIVLFSFLVIFLIYSNFFSAPKIKAIETKNSMTEDDKVIINVEVSHNIWQFNNNKWCIISTTEDVNLREADWQIADNGYCSFTTEDDNYYVFVRDSHWNTNSSSVEKFLIKVKKDVYYMYPGMEDQLDILTDKKGLHYSSENEGIVSITNDGAIKANNPGVTNVVIENKNKASKEVKIHVSNLIRKPKVDNERSKITCNQFSETEAKLLDNALFSRVNDVGYATRAGVVAAARFLALEMTYKVPYFYENGRINNYPPYKHVDGEGRYYHRGLYLSKQKFQDIQASLVGPALWGCNIENFTNWSNYKYSYVAGKFYPNGLDCSGFVTWALLNGGFDIGDIGAGENEEHDDLDDLGPKHYITNQLMNSGIVKVGDLIGFNGHMAILSGWDDDYYYIAESLNTTDGVVMTMVEKNKIANSAYKYIILMDDIYKEDGNLTNIWE